MQNAELKTMAEMEQAYLNPKIRTEFRYGYVTLTDGEYVDYDIALSRITTPEELLTWVHHLTEKNWMDAQSLRHFIASVVDHQKFDPSALHLPA